MLTYESVLPKPGLKVTFFKKMDNPVFVRGYLVVGEMGSMITDIQRYTTTSQRVYLYIGFISFYPHEIREKLT